MPWFVRLAMWLRPREGWPVFFLALAAVLCLPMAALDFELLPGLGPLFWLALLGLLLAWRAGHAQLRPVASWVGLLGAGVLADLMWGVQVLHFGPLVTQVYQWLAWRADPATALLHTPAPPITWPVDQWASLANFGQRVGWWWAGLVGAGRPVADNLVLVGLAALICWLAAIWAGWWISRHARPLEALLPTTFLLALLTFVTNRDPLWLLALLAVLPPLVTLCRGRRLAGTWDRAAIDYSTEIHLTSFFIGISLSLVVLLATPVLPFITSKQMADAFWHMFEKPYRQVEQHVNQSFPQIQGARSLIPLGGVAENGLPRSHLLGGKPQLGQEVALKVSVRGAHPDDRLYWRGQTYAVYTGSGWEVGPQQPRMVALAAGQPWSAAQPAARHAVLATVNVVGGTRGVFYAPGEPVSVDRPYQAQLAASGDLIALLPDGGSAPRTYTVLVAAADENPNALRAAPRTYPDAVRGQYLQLPDNLPPELVRYAHDVTAGAASPYDAAAAIEKALREFPYTLDVPAPPAGRELVSWFLFDLRRGYCDYYASAMVVLARLTGIPARLAIGYATGTWDPQNSQYVVTELQAHSWPELYFPGQGWVRFEPTAGLAEPARTPAAVPDWLAAGQSRPPEMDREIGELRQSAAQRAAVDSRQRRLGWALAAAQALLALWMLWRWRRPGEIDTGARYGLAYRRLAGWGRRLGRPLAASETPREYATALAATAAAAGRAARGGAAAQQAAATAAACVESAAPRLAQEFEQAAYNRGRAAPAAAWLPLWSALRRLWLARTLRL